MNRSQCQCPIISRTPSRGFPLISMPFIAGPLDDTVSPPNRQTSPSTDSLSYFRTDCVAEIKSERGTSHRQYNDLIHLHYSGSWWSFHSRLKSAALFIIISWRDTFPMRRWSSLWLSGGSFLFTHYPRALTKSQDAPSTTTSRVVVVSPDERHSNHLYILLFAIRHVGGQSQVVGPSVEWLSDPVGGGDGDVDLKGRRRFGIKNEVVDLRGNI